MYIISSTSLKVQGLLPYFINEHPSYCEVSNLPKATQFLSLTKSQYIGYNLCISTFVTGVCVRMRVCVYVCILMSERED